MCLDCIHKCRNGPNLNIFCTNGKQWLILAEAVLHVHKKNACRTKEANQPSETGRAPRAFEFPHNENHLAPWGWTQFTGY